MPGLSLFYSYFGAVPFIALALLSFVMHGSDHHQTLALLQLCYSTIILSFFGGVYWNAAIRSGDQRLISLSMAPSVLAFIAFGIGLFGYTVIALFLLSVLFYGVFKVDKLVLDKAIFSPEYLKTRRNLTIIVCACLLATAYFQKI